MLLEYAQKHKKAQTVQGLLNHKKLLTKQESTHYTHEFCILNHRKTHAAHGEYIDHRKTLTAHVWINYIQTNIDKPFLQNDYTKST